ncbi:carbon-nitrogen hydrolase [Streptomyces carminius]|uniref:Carbon-nitrogen hydrolase n=1 Tax=Streptomyces carminius TaxID=2665496 RepID=A0A2M8MBW1_9ACTN|nr:carbon-nitrogen family hydrolase [Streptomyces carminius]PJF01626.1 carbon-nitrogen hydrolase [Streptomyces carminius]
MRASLIQIAVNQDETAEDRRVRAAALVREQSAADLVVLPELWTVGAFDFDSFAAGAEPLRGPAAKTVAAMSGAAREARVWLHAGSVIERADEPAAEPAGDPSGTPALYNTSLVFSPEGALVRTYRKIHRFGFDRGEATLLSAGTEPVTAVLPDTTLGLATCYDLRFPELFRALTEAGARTLVIPAGWPDRRAAHWSLLARARAVENQCYVLACGTAGTHAGVPQAGRSAVIDPWGETLAEASDAEEQVVMAEFDPAYADEVRADFPVLRDRVLR